MNGVQGPSRLLNHSRFPNGRAHGFAAPLRVALGFGPSAHRAHASLRALPGFGADSGRSIVAEGAGRAHRSFRSPPSGRFALCATAHRADASLRCPKPCAAAQKSERCECPKGTRNAPRSTPPRISAQTARPSSTRRGRAASIQKTLSLERPAFLASLRSLATLDGLCRRKRRRPPASSCIKPRFLLPSVARNARRALPPEALASSASSCIKPRFSRPSVARNARRALPPEAPPSSAYSCIKPRFLRPGCSIIRASLTVALMVSLSSQISAFCALAARSPCICSRLRVALRCAQQPTG